eukprot:1150838-Pelagomonas_calceolata.AAC.6
MCAHEHTRTHTHIQTPPPCACLQACLKRVESGGGTPHTLHAAAALACPSLMDTLACQLPSSSAEQLRTVMGCSICIVQPKWCSCAACSGSTAQQLPGQGPLKRGQLDGVDEHNPIEKGSEGIAMD